MSSQQLINQHVADGLHERVKEDEAQWCALAFVGIGTGLEFRNCSCGSTLARVIDGGA